MDGQVSLYRLYDVRGILLYVGITSRKTLRQSEHAGSQPWWHLVCSQHFDHYPTREQAAAAEITAITTEVPVFNVVAATGADARRDAYEMGLYEIILRAQAPGRKVNNKRRRKASEAHLAPASGSGGRALRVPADVLADAVVAGLISPDPDTPDVGALLVDLRENAVPLGLRKRLGRQLLEPQHAEWLTRRMLGQDPGRVRDPGAPWWVGARDVPLADLPGWEWVA